MADYREFPTYASTNACSSNCTKHTQNSTQPRHSSKCEELIGVIFSVIGKEFLLPILCEVTKLKVADWDESLNRRFDNTSYFYGSLSALPTTNKFGACTKCDMPRVDCFN